METITPFDDFIEALLIETNQKAIDLLEGSKEENTRYNHDPTIMLHSEEESFSAQPLDTTAFHGWARPNRERKLIVDQKKTISVKQMKSHMSDTTDIVTTLEIAPQTKEFMRWAETGRVETLLVLPGRPIPALPLFRAYQRNLTSKQTEREDFDPESQLHFEEILQVESAEMFTPRPNSLLAIAGADVPLESKRTNNRILSEEEEWYYHGPNKSRRYRYNFCGDCAYKTFSRHSLVLHIDLHHPYSTTALPPRRRQKPLKTGRQNLVKKKRPKRQVKGINKRSFDHCKYKTDQKHVLEKHEITHQSKINDHCLFCSKTIKLLSAHLKKDHPERNELINQLDLFTSATMGGMKDYADNVHPSEEIATAIQLSTSEKKEVEEEDVSEKTCLNHDGNDMSGKEVKEMASTATLPMIEEKTEGLKNQPVKREKTKKDWMKKFGLRHCHVKLHDLAFAKKVQPESRMSEELPTDSTDSKSSNGLPMKRKCKSKEMNCASQISGNQEEEVVYIGQTRSRRTSEEPRSTSEVHNEIQMMRNRVALMEEKARIANEELKKINLDKESSQIKITETAIKKIETEIELRTNQCKAIDLKLALHEENCEEVEEKKQSLELVEELIKKLEGVVERMGFQLEAMGKEEADLLKNLENAETSYSGIMQVLNALKSELKSQ